MKMKKQHKSVEKIEEHLKSMHKDFRDVVEHYELELEKLCQKLSRGDIGEGMCSANRKEGLK